MGLTSLPPIWTMSLNILFVFFRVPLKIILKGCYTDYTEAYLYFDTTTQKQRREKLCICFARKKQLFFFIQFDPGHKAVNIRSEKAVVNEFKCTSRYFNSSLELEPEEPALVEKFILI